MDEQHHSINTTKHNNHVPHSTYPTCAKNSSNNLSPQAFEIRQLFTGLDMSDVWIMYLIGRVWSLWRMVEMERTQDTNDILTRRTCKEEADLLWRAIQLRHDRWDGGLDIQNIKSSSSSSEAVAGTIQLIVKGRHHQSTFCR